MDYHFHCITLRISAIKKENPHLYCLSYNLGKINLNLSGTPAGDHGFKCHSVQSLAETNLSNSIQLYVFPINLSGSALFLE